MVPICPGTRVLESPPSDLPRFSDRVPPPQSHGGVNVPYRTTNALCHSSLANPGGRGY